MTGLDAVLVGIVNDRLWAILKEQQDTLVATAFSSVVRESLDLACSVFDSQGRMIGQSIGGTPGHINAMATGMRHVVDTFPADHLVPGDAVITNDPWMTAGQINDLTVASPVHRADRLVGWFASCCHSADIGGRLLSAEANDVYEEGLRIPPMLLTSESGIDPVLETLIRANVRTPDETVGDLRAQLAANHVAAARLGDMMDELGIDVLDPVGAEIMDRSERAMRTAIRGLDDGRFSATTTADGFDDEALFLSCTVAVSDDELTIDFAGTSPESAHGINVVYNYTQAYASFAIKAALAPDVPHNAGSFRPVTVSAPEGSLLNCRHPAPVASRHIVGHFIPGLIYEALRPAMGDRLLAYGSEALWLTVFTGSDRDGRPFVFNTFQAGGMGARPTKDGLSTTGFPTGVRAAPTEVIEATSPLVQTRRQLLVDSGGAGRYRGGLGQQTTMSCDSGREWTVNANIDRLRSPAAGADGGRSGMVGAFGLVDGGPLPSKRRINVDPGASVLLDLPGGGGHGDPRTRPVDEVMHDVVEGYVSLGAARDEYGVAVRYVGPADALVRPPEYYRLDDEETERLRASVPTGD